MLANLYDDWLFPLRERLRTEYLNALDALVLEHRSRRDLHAAADYAQRMLRTDPWREDALRHLIAARYEAGDRAGALAIYDQFKRRLRDEMDVDPMPETEALRDVVVRNAPLVEQQAQGALQRADASRAQHLNLPFVGRDAEMEQLRALWSRAARGRGGLAFVSGEAGIGKTRLVSELALLVESEGGRVTYGGTSSPEAAPYQCLADALRSALPLVAAMELEPIWLSVIAQIVPELRTRVPDLPELPATDPGRDRLRLFEGIARGLEALARSRPLLVIVEDLHWAGEATLSALRFGARRAAAASILIVGTYREEEAPRTHPLRRLRRELSAERIVAGLSPQRLSPVFVAELIAALPQALAIDAAGARSLHEQSEGNPLFLAQLVRDRIESQEPVRGVLSGGIKDIIETRIARLSERGLAFAGFAAVVGQGFDAEVVAELSGWEQHELFEALSELIDRHLVQETGGRGRAAYSFTHHLIQATVYDGMDGAAHAASSAAGACALRHHRARRSCVERDRARITTWVANLLLPLPLTLRPPATQARCTPMKMRIGMWRGCSSSTRAQRCARKRSYCERRCWAGAGTGPDKSATSTRLRRWPMRKTMTPCAAKRSIGASSERIRSASAT